MTALIDVGGGMRDIYGTGVTDCFLDNNIRFDLCIGVSAGAANLISYIAGQKIRNYKFYAEYASRKEYMSMSNYLRTGSFMNFDYIYSELSNEGCENPLDYEALVRSDTELVVVATDAETGKAEYFTKKDVIRNDYWVLKASCSIPVVNKPYEYNGKLYVDGGISDPIPVEKAFEMGADHVVVIIPRPIAEKKSSIGKYAKPFLRHYPAVLDKMLHRMEIYNSGIETMSEYEKAGKLTVIVPDSDKGLNMVTTDHAKLTAYYNKGYNDALKYLKK